MPCTGHGFSSCFGEYHLFLNQHKNNPLVRLICPHVVGKAVIGREGLRACNKSARFVFQNQFDRFHRFARRG